MAGSKFGSLYSIMTFGESHGPFIGVVIDGVKPGIPIDTDALQQEMNRRRPGQSKVTTPRDEKDQAQIVSGVFEGKTTGTPICILIQNQDQRSKDYSKFAKIVRPGHAAFTYLKKYGIFDYRGGGRASGRETATRVAAGAIAKQILQEYGVDFKAFVSKIGPHEINSIDYDFIEKNPVRTCDPDAAAAMETFIRQAADEGDSVGGIVELHIKGLPAGLGDPVFEKIDAELAHGIMSIGALKGIEFGSGFKAAEMKASENNDVFHVGGNGNIEPKTNHAGGILGGISTGQDLVLRIAVKPPSSINKIQHTVNWEGEEVPLTIGGRHDPCICPRVVPVAEAVAALVILDLLLVQENIQEKTTNIEMLNKEIDLVDGQLLMLLKKRLTLTQDLVEKQGRASFANDGTELPENLQSKLEHFAEELALDKSMVKQIWKQIEQEAADLTT